METIAPIKKVPVVINFLDHSSSSGSELGLFECEVIGYLVEETKTYFKLITWIANGVANDDNSEGYTILKHPGIKIRRLR